MQLVFWQNMVAFHQSAHVRALAAKGHDVTFIAEDVMHPERRAMGWTIPDLGEAKLLVIQDDDRVKQLVPEFPADAVHLIGGVRGYRIGKQALRYCLQTNRRVGFLSEAPGLRS